MPFLKGDDKKVVFSKLEEIFDNNEGSFSKLISYYKKNLVKQRVYLLFGDN